MAFDKLGKKFTYPWLPTLIKAHALIDQAVNVSRKNEYAATGRSLACKKGCDDCCHHIIPVSAPEIAGVLWHLIEQTSVRLRARVQQNINSPSGHACPFLINRTCCVYPMRFMACRQFVIFDNPCPGNEDVSITRSQDLLTPNFHLKMKAFEQLATLYGVEPRLPLDAKFLREFIMAVSAPVQAWDFARSEMILFQLEKNMLRYQGRDETAPVRPRT
jgi:hypothetical protein